MVEDVLVQVDKFYSLVDFIVLDTEPVVYSDSQIPIILGRPFLATSNADINCRNGLMQLSFGNMTLEFNIFNICKQPANNEDVDKEVYMIETIVQNCFNSSFSYDPLQICLVQEHNGWIPKYEELPTVRDETKSSREEAPKCELKPLPTGLKYAFLGEDETYPVVISSKLDLLHEGMLLKVVKDHRTAIGWTLSNIKGIIYPISDSKWVSPTQVVPKKLGVTVVENDNGETRLGQGDLKPISIMLQLSDWSITYPRGVIEDLIIKVDNHYLLANFVVLDMDLQTPIILGRPFMATARTLIDVEQEH
ncbi:hypothetical protein L3X38_042252 [Prunus dulcis]|uniref:Uncharacterized protein n=1 Tax=Prunus dulcis TaxID=3755 RepID=A0AAD4UVK3_PRUDU|nr:hypothetical protein L3X38_042252 [Prunus dulcis]